MIRYCAWLSLGVVAATLSSATDATAQITKTWTGASGDWNDGSKWSGGTAPGDNDIAVIAPNDGVARTINFNSSAILTALYVDLAGFGTAATTFAMPNDSFLTVHNIWAGGWNGAAPTTGRGVIDQSTGIVSITPGGGPFDILDLGVYSGSTGTYNLSGGTLQANAHEYVGDVGTGIFNHTGGTNSIYGIGHNLYIGGGPNNGVGTYTISNSGSLLATNGNVIVGNASTGTGTLTIQNQASVDILNNLIINSHGTVNLNGGTLRFNTISGLNRLNYTAGTIQLAANRTLDTDATIAYLFGPFLSPPASISIPSGKGLHVEGDAFQFQPNKTVTVNGGSLSSTNHTIGTILNGGGTLVVNNGGTVTTSANATLGDVSGSSGTATVSGPASIWSIGGSLTVGGSGTGTLSILDQSLAYVGSALSINSVSTVNLQGGTLRFNTVSGLNRLTYSSGTIQLAGDRGIGGDTTISTLFGTAFPVIPIGKGLVVEGTATLTKPLTIDGGTFKATSLAVGAGGAFIFDHGILEISGGGVTGISNLVVPAYGEYRASGVQTTRITGAAGSTITATADLTLGDSSLSSGFYSNGTFNVGPYVVTLADANDAVLDSAALVTIGAGGSPGTLNAANGLTLDFGGNITGFGTVSTPNNLAKPLINNGHFTGNSVAQPLTLTGYVKGVGTFDNVSFIGTFSPGLSPTILSVGNVALSDTSTLVMELGGTAPASGYDQIQATGTLSFDGTLQLSLINGFIPIAGQSFNLFDWVSTNGTFDTIQLPTLAGLTWNTSQLYSDGILSLAAAVNLPGDYNHNGIVDAADYTVWRDSLGSTTDLRADGDNTGASAGKIDQADYIFWKANFGNHSGAGANNSATTAVPEPATLLPFLAGILTMCWGRRQNVS